MVRQYLKYLEDKKDGAEDDKMAGDQWFKQLAQDHPNANINMNVKKVDTASANEESEFNDKFLDTFMAKEVILPTIGVILAIVAIWAFMTKCGKRKCCKDDRKQRDSDQLSGRKSVKSSSDRGASCASNSNSNSNNANNNADDLESQNNTKMMASDKSNSSQCAVILNREEVTVNKINQIELLSAPSR